MIPTPRPPFARQRSYSACGLLFALAACKSEAPQAGDELAGVTQFVANGSFEEMDGENPKGWRHRSWQRGGDAVFAVDRPPAARAAGAS